MPALRIQHHSRIQSVENSSLLYHLVTRCLYILLCVNTKKKKKNSRLYNAVIRSGSRV